jgi:hypothetical protein
MYLVFLTVFISLATYSQEISKKSLCRVMQDIPKYEEIYIKNSPNCATMVDVREKLARYLNKCKIEDLNSLHEVIYKEGSKFSYRNYKFYSFDHLTNKQIQKRIVRILFNNYRGGSMHLGSNADCDHYLEASCSGKIYQVQNCY